MKNRHFLLYGVLGAALLVAVFTAYDRHNAAEQSRLYLQDSYTRHLLEAQEHLQAAAVKLAKAPVASDARTCVELLTGASRQADGVAGALSALPLSHAAMSDTVKFCNQVSEYTLMLALKSASGESISAAEAKMLQDLQRQCTLLTGQLVTADASEWSAQNVFWESAALESRPLEQVSDPDNGMDYPSMIYDGAFSDARHRGTPKALGMQQVDQAQAIDIARSFVGESRVRSAEAGVPTGGAIECWGVTLVLNDGQVLNADVTRQGGKMLWIMPEHANFEARLTLEECTGAAQAFLRTRGYGEMEANHYQVYDGLAVINFVAVQDGVLLYPDLIKVQIRMDTGELVGLESNNYLMNHEKRPSLASSITEAQARAKISPRLTISSMRLCVIPYRDQERLCWEAAGTYLGGEYRVYVDAHTGEEVEVLQIVDTSAGRMAA